MSLYVNTNVVSLNAQNNLNKSTSALTKSLERLSSGLRINRAGDDAAGLAISENLRSQIRGLNQAVRNAQDGLSLVGTAEGAVNETVNILQRLRELSVQSANDTNSSGNRAAMQAEVNQMLEEVDRIATTVQFNGRSLLDGSFTDQKLQIGAFKGQNISFSISDFRSGAIGATASVTSTAPTAALAAGDLTVNGVDVGVSADDGVSTANGTFSAIAIAASVNSVQGQTGVTAEANATSVTGGAAIAGGTLDGTNNFSINGVTFGSGTDSISVAAGDADGALRAAINAKSNETGVTATLSGTSLVLSAADGRNIEVTASGTGATMTGVAAATTVGTVTLSSASNISIGGSSPADAGLTAGVTGVDANSALNTIDVSTQNGSEDAIVTIDAALAEVNALRGDLGALTNRLESTISNLRTTSENLSASESRIRDTDFAQETAKLTRAQILQQAGTAILAQANVTSQAALSLLG